MSVVGPTRTIFTARIAAAVKGILLQKSKIE
jgi:hypothetical protein